MKRLLIANWKMNPGTLGAANRLASAVERGLRAHNLSPGLSPHLGRGGGVDVAICPPFPFLVGVNKVLKKVKLGAQDIAAEESGPFTGEVSARQLKALGVKYVIVGHSERRAMGEDDNVVNRKVKLALAHKIEPVICVGYGATKNMNDSQIKKVVAKQLSVGLKGVSKQAKLSITYEPVWVISKGLGKAKLVSPASAANIIKFIKSRIRNARVLYGASITPKNAGELARYKEIQGGIVGGASLEVKGFLNIIKAFS